ncbi:uncharacterized protein [Gossypium hirsutum]|uniref:DNA/RNA polymerases superfamily protein n=1 Tax=Gossypium hirsutum TaxID=3635 RepID=A0ABM2YMZ7_GOSHI|nr:uncharacterized protein LOC121205050 [Gossypium hirsutum]
MASKLLQQGCSTYLAYVIHLDSVGSQCELPGLSPDREVELAIEVYPSTAPISIPPYRMSPTELKELKIQLQDLLDRGFIQPSISPLLPVESKRKLRSKDSFPYKCQESFEKLKQMLTEAPILTLPESRKDFIVYSDASLSGLHCVLMQEGKVIASTSRQLKPHKRKANIVADALSRKVANDLREMFARLSIYDDRSLIAELKVKPVMFDQIKSTQLKDDILLKKREMIQTGTVENFSIDAYRCLRYRDRVCVPAKSKLKELILREAHDGSFALHPRGTKMHCDLRDLYWWPGMKRDIVEYVGKCLTCQQVTAEHQGIEYSVGDKVFLKVSSWKKVLRFGRKERIGPVAYRLALPPELQKIHNVFQVSMLRRYRSDPFHVISIEDIEIQPDLSYKEEPVEILAREIKELRNKRVPLVKVLWKSHKVEEATWELEESMRARYPPIYS